MNKKYYHVAPIRARDKILQEGLIATDDKIWLFDTIEAQTGHGSFSVADSIALSQCGLSEYALFEIDGKGIDKLILDNVAEITAKFQFIALQKCIGSTHIKHIGDNKVDPMEDSRKYYTAMFGKEAAEVLLSQMTQINKMNTKQS